MEFCKKKYYLINKIMSLSKSNLIKLIEKFPDIDIAAILIREILNIKNSGDYMLTNLINIADSLENLDNVPAAGTDKASESSDVVLISDAVIGSGSTEDFGCIEDDVKPADTYDSDKYNSDTYDTSGFGMPDTSGFGTPNRYTSKPDGSDRDFYKDINDYSSEIKNRRISPRKSVSMDVNLVRKNSTLLEECIDISASGMFIKTDECFSQNEDVTVTLMISQNGIKEELAFESKVVRTPDNGVGLQFNTMDHQNKSKLEELLKNI